ncbi:MAG: ABC transporter ATP-binding protein [Polyangiaceae bacterium]
MLAGVRAPLRGTVRIAGADPWTSPAARARTGALLAAPDVPDASSVRACVAQSLSALGRDPSGAAAVLGALGLGLLAARRTESLSFAEARAVELALALAVVSAAPPPALLVLFEPCTDLALPGGTRAVEDAIAARRADGACVILLTSSAADATRLADTTWLLHRGALLRREPSASRALSTVDSELAVTLAPGDSASLRTLASTLAADPAVHAALWEDPAAGSTRSPVLRLRGPDRDALALAVAGAAARAGVAVASIASSTPDLPAVRSAALSWIQRVRNAASPFLRRPAQPAAQAAPAPSAPLETRAAPDAAGPPSAAPGAESPSPEAAPPAPSAPAAPERPAPSPEAAPPAPGADSPSGEEPS